MAEVDPHEAEPQAKRDSLSSLSLKAESGAEFQKEKRGNNRVVAIFFYFFSCLVHICSFRFLSHWNPPLV